MKNFLQHKFGLFLVFFLGSISAFILPLVKFSSHILTRDWGLFDANSLFIHSCAHHYGKLPLHNPYLFGGMDVAANPQSRVFSPMVLFDLLFSAPFANLFSLIFLAFVGSYGFFYLLKYLKVNHFVSVVVAVLFVHASWFHLHYSEGHIIFGSFLLFGWVIYFILRLEDARFKVWYAVLCAFMLLDGGIYAFIYAQLLMFFMLVFQVNGISFGKLFRSMIHDKRSFIVSIIVFIGLSSFKLIPLLMSHMNRTPVLENIALDIKSVLSSFFNPMAFVRLEIQGANFSNYMNYLELGAYIGLVAFGVIVFFLVKHWRRSFVPYLLVILMFLWIGSGWFDPINPWRLFQKLPIVNNAHIQTRGLFIVYCFLLILLAFGLNSILQKRRSVFLILIAFLLVESQWTATHPYIKVFEMADCSLPTSEFPTMVTHSTIEKTIDSPQSKGWGFDFQHYQVKNLATKGFMDPTAENTNGFIKTVNDKGYRGEVYVLDGSGSVSLKEFIPSQAEVQIDVKKGAIIQLNSNFLHGWNSNNQLCTVFEKNGLLTMKVNSDFKGKIKLFYTPSYFWWCVGLTFFGLIFLLLFLMRLIR